MDASFPPPRWCLGRWGLGRADVLQALGKATRDRTKMSTLWMLASGVELVS